VTQRRAPEQAGFTLVELMISLVLFSFAIAGVLAVAVSMSQGFREQRAAVEAEGAVRVPIDFIADAIRQSSPAAPTLTFNLGVPAAANIQDAGTCSVGSLNVQNNQTAVHDPTLNGWDALDVIYASGAVVTSSRSAYVSGSTSLDVNDASQLSINDSIVISDTNQGTFVNITGISGNTLTLATQCGSLVLPSGGYAAGALVIRAEHATFTIDAVDGIPTLMMDPDAGGPQAPQPLAEGVEDMQIAFGIDTDANGSITETTNGVGDEWQGNAAGDSPLTGTLRAVRISLVSRTTSGLVGNLNPYNRPAVEDHAASTTMDQYRRRVLQSTVEIRNMAQSP